MFIARASLSPVYDSVFCVQGWLAFDKIRHQRRLGPEEMYLMRLSPIKVTIFSLMLMLALMGVACAAEQTTDGAAVVNMNLMKLPLVFIPNQGQADPSVLYQVRAEGHSIFFTKDNVVLATVKDDKPVSFSTTVAGINPAVTVTGVDPQQGTANFYLGNDPNEWQNGIPTYGGVEYQNVLPGIDLTYKGSDGLLKREFTVAPDADPSAIVITYDGIDSIAYGPDGTLEVTTPSGVITEAAPVAYQVINGQNVAVPAQYSILGDRKGRISRSVIMIMHILWLLTRNSSIPITSAARSMIVHWGWQSII